MRKFTKQEKDLISIFVNCRNNNQLQDLQVAKILKENILFFAISWDTNPKGKMTIFTNKNDELADNDNVTKTFMSISDFIYFLKELESYQFIKFITMSNLESGNYEKKIYNRSKYSYSNELQSFVLVNPISVDGNERTAVIQTNHTDFFLDAAADLDDISNKIIYPLPALQEYVRNKYQTREDEFQLKALAYSFGALIAAAIAFVVDIITK